jgi:hypothetical protein
MRRRAVMRSKRRREPRVVERIMIVRVSREGDGGVSAAVAVTIEPVCEEDVESEAVLAGMLWLVVDGEPVGVGVLLGDDIDCESSAVLTAEVVRAAEAEGVEDSMLLMSTVVVVADRGGANDAVY